VKVCPLRFPQPPLRKPHSNELACLGSKCEWWVRENQMCCQRLRAMAADHAASAAEAQFQTE
jgi:hypothetical protein